MQHTLAPWKAEPDTQAHCNNRNWITGISSNDGRRAHVAADVVTHNVALICAAPEMLAMLRKMYVIEMNPAVSAELIALIEKAEGKRS